MRFQMDCPPHEKLWPLSASSQIFEVIHCDMIGKAPFELNYSIVMRLVYAVSKISAFASNRAQ